MINDNPNTLDDPSNENGFDGMDRSLCFHHCRCYRNHNERCCHCGKKPCKRKGKNAPGIGDLDDFTTSLTSDGCGEIISIEDDGGHTTVR